MEQIPAAQRRWRRKKTTESAGESWSLQMPRKMMPVRIALASPATDVRFAASQPFHTRRQPETEKAESRPPVHLEELTARASDPESPSSVQWVVCQRRTEWHKETRKQRLRPGGH